MIQDQKDRPDYRNKASQAMQRGWEIVRDVAAGALCLRDKGKAYLPQFPAEHDRKYEIRRRTATLFNAYQRTVMGLVGMMFKKNPTLSADVPETIRGRAEEVDESGEVKTPKAEGHVENIDLAGNHLDVFSRSVVEDAMIDGHAFVLVDMQKPLQPGATLADELRAGLRPYWVKYKACQAVNFRPVTINGQLEIGQITFEEETSAEAGEYGEREVKRYRTFKLLPYADLETQEIRHVVTWTLKEKVIREGQEQFDVIGEGTIRAFDRIPVAVVYGKKVGFLESQPPLLDLALLNISYFQKKSDRDNNLHLCGSPTPVFAGVPEDWNMVVSGSGYGIKLPTGATAAYMEPAGVALEESRLDLQALRGEMAALGLSALEGRPAVSATATETVIDFTQESSELESIARSASDAFELCLQFHAKYLGLKSGGSLSLGSHLKSIRLTAQQIQVYSQMCAAGDLSRWTLWEILRHGDALPDTFDAKTEEERLRKQQKSLGESLLKDFDKGGDGGGDLE